MPQRHESGFTLVEVLIAMAVLAIFTSGLLVTTWHLVGFAKDQVEHMVADNYCHDVTWAVYSQNFTNMLSWANRDNGELTTSWQILPERKQDLDSSKWCFEVPQIVKVDLFGRKSIEYPLWRSADANLRPQCNVRVKEISQDSKEICVTIRWHNGKDWQSHSNVVMRSNIERRFR